MALFCHVIWKDDVINDSSNFIGRIPSSYHPATFSGYGNSINGCEMFLLCQMTLQDHVIKAINGSIVMSLARDVTILPSLIAISIAVVKMQQV